MSDQNPGVAGTDTGTVTINVATPKVWYVNADAASDGDGSSENPFNTLTHFNGVGGVDGAGDTIVLETSAAHYTGGLTLENNEQLLSQSAGVTINGTTFDFAPTGWATCDGQLLPISQNTALFSLLGTFYGGDGKSTFALPSLDGSAALNQGQGPGLTDRVLGEIGGEQSLTLLTTEMPAHNHFVTASNQIGTDRTPNGEDLARSKGMPRSLREVKVGPEHFDRIAQQAMATPWVPRNPRKIEGPAQVREILELAA